MANLISRKSACSHSLLPATATPARYHTSPSLGNHIRIHTVLLQNGGFCNGCITELCLQSSRKVSLNDLASQLLYDKRLNK
jgi:hypothetical protein